MRRFAWMRSAATAAAALMIAACAEPAQTPGTEEGAAGALPAGHPDISQGGAAAQAPEASGPVVVVKETMDAGGYTYALLGIEDEEMWAAGPPTELAVGDSVVLAGAMGMTDFHSKALDRTFDQILFVGGFVPAAEAASTFPGNSGTVVETMSSGGYTYVNVEIAGETLWLAGPEVTVAVGDTVGWMDGNLMRAFSSSTLDRTFDAILFVPEIKVLN